MFTYICADDDGMALMRDRYCFGGPYVMDALAGDLCEVGAFAHPAFLEDRHFENIKSESCAVCVVRL